MLFYNVYYSRSIFEFRTFTQLIWNTLHTQHSKKVASLRFPMKLTKWLYCNSESIWQLDYAVFETFPL